MILDEIKEVADKAIELRDAISKLYDRERPDVKEYPKFNHWMADQKVINELFNGIYIELTRKTFDLARASLKEI